MNDEFVAEMTKRTEPFWKFILARIHTHTLTNVKAINRNKQSSNDSPFSHEKIEHVRQDGQWDKYVERDLEQPGDVEVEGREQNHAKQGAEPLAWKSIKRF